MALWDGRDSEVSGDSPTPTGHQDPDVGVGKHTRVQELESQLTVQRRARAPGLGPTTADVQTAAIHGTQGGGDSLPHLDTIQRLFGRHDVSRVQAHTDGNARQGATAMGAAAFASGSHVAFAAAPDLHLAAHEAAHVVQQRGGVQLKGDVGEMSDPYERHADAVADAVVGGRSAESLLDTYAGNSRSVATVQRAPEPDTGKDQQARSGSNVARLIELLHQPPTLPWGWEMGYAFLGELAMPDLLTTLGAIADRGLLPQLETRARANSSGPHLRARMLAAVHIIELAGTPKGANDPRLQQVGSELDQLSQSEQLQVIEYLLVRRGATVAATTLMEGVLAMRQDQAADSSVTASAPTGPTMAAGVTGPATNVADAPGQPGPIEPGPWAPPGDQPIPFYIGNEAHKGIAAEYATAHAGDDVRSNAYPIKSMLGALTELGQKPKAGELNDTELGLMPDIVNLTRLHLYEIKPLAAQALGAAKATFYLGLFGRAGIAMQLGPSSEPGTAGQLPAPGGVYIFWSPAPGVIVYQYRRGRLVPVPIPVPERAPATERRWRFELQPLKPEQRQAVATFTVGAALLLAAMILLSPIGI